MKSEFKYPPTLEQMELAAVFYGTPEQERPFLVWTVKRAAKCIDAEVEGSPTPVQARFFKTWRQLGHPGRTETELGLDGRIQAVLLWAHGKEGHE